MAGQVLKVISIGQDELKCSVLTNDDQAAMGGALSKQIQARRAGRI
jgi:hypothetical protein